MAIVKTRAYFNSSTGSDKIHCMIWQDDEVETKGVLQIAHSSFEHIERYHEFASFMASSGLVVCGNDHLGHGLSVQSEEGLGFICQTDGDIRLVDDMHILHNIMAARYSELPYFLFGHGMGSICARVYASNFGTELAGLIICGTCKLPSAALMLEKSLILMCNKFGATARIPTSILDTISNLSVKDKTTPKDWLTRNKDTVNDILLDPLCNFDLKLGAVRDIVSLINTACTPQWAELVPTSLKILLISGAKDPIGLNGKGVIDVSEKLEQAGHEPEVLLYPGSRHNILHEEEKKLVFFDVLDFLYSSGLEEED